MTKQPEALRVARMLEMRETYGADASLDLDAMDELRRLHEVNVELLAALKTLIARYQGKKQGVWGELTPEMLSARAAIAKATGETE